MAELKNKPTDESVEAFLAAIPDDERRKDCRVIARMMQQATKAKPKMWGAGMVGFGNYHYKYASGREGDWFLTGFSPRKHALTVYIVAGFTQYDALLNKLGKYKTGKSCLYVKRLDDIDVPVLEELIKASVDHVSQAYAEGSGAA